MVALPFLSLEENRNDKGFEECLRNGHDTCLGTCFHQRPLRNIHLGLSRGDVELLVLPDQTKQKNYLEVRSKDFLTSRLWLFFVFCKRLYSKSGLTLSDFDFKTVVPHHYRAIGPGFALQLETTKPDKTQETEVLQILGTRHGGQ